MLNQTIVVGRIVSDPEVVELENGKQVANLTLAVQRSYKNIAGEYDTDFLPCILWEGVAVTTSKYCQKGDLIGVRGRLQTSHDKDGKLEVSVIAERVSFLSSKKTMDETDVNIEDYEENIPI